MIRDVSARRSGAGAVGRHRPCPTQGRFQMRIVHVITRLILGGAQENTLLTVDELHHRYHDEVTLITGPAEGPEGDLFDRAAAAGSERRGDARAGSPDPALGRPESLLAAARGVSAARDPRSCTPIARKRASWAAPPPGTNGCRRSSIPSTECRSGRSRRRSRTACTSRSRSGRPAGLMRSSAYAMP